MALTQRQSVITDNKMFEMMQKYSFDRTIVIKKFMKWAKLKGYKLSQYAAYKKYDKVLKKVQTFPEFHQNVQQFFRHMSLVSNRVIQDALKNGDIQDYLAMARLQMDALCLKSENHNVVFNQFNDNKVQTNVNLSPEELLGRVTAGLERFGGLIQHAGRIGAVGGNQPVLTIPATSKAGADTGGGK